MQTGKLEGSKFDRPEAIDYLVQDFDKTTKRVFASDAKPQWVAVGMPGDRDQQIGVLNGKLKLEGYAIHSR